MLQAAQILERERIRPRAVAKVEPARLRAQAAVAAAPAEHAGERAAAGRAHAQRAVDKHLDFQRRGRGDGGDLLHGQLPGKHHARKAETAQHFHACGIVHGHLRGGVQGQRGTHATHERGGADILHDHGVRARSRNVAHSVRKRIQFRIQQKRVERDVHAHLPRMAIRHGALEGLRVKVCRVAARVESGKAEIDRIRATAHRR